jgi:hypothetical protein
MGLNHLSSTGKIFVMALTSSLLALVSDIFNRKRYQHQIIIKEKLK